MAPVGQIVLIKTSVTLTYRTKCVDKNLCNPDKYWNYRGLFFQKTIFYVREKTCVIEKILRNLAGNGTISKVSL